ncbi:MAG TPA: hypothetical protein VIY72_05300, partial [Acidimicrobiales bacterium]
SGQRWGLGALAVVAAVGASASAGFADGHLPVVLLLVVALLAVVAVVMADSYVASVVIAVVVVQWFVETDGAASAWSLAAATGLVVFHLLVALMAVTPSNAIVAAPVLVRWARRGGAVLGATVAVWGAAAALDGRSVPGSVALVLVALVALTGVVVAVCARSTASSGSR